MLRKVAGLAACCLFLSWGAAAAPRKDDPASRYYFSTKVGDKLVSAFDDGEQQWERLSEVAEVVKKGDVLTVTFRKSGASDDDPGRYEVSDKGVFKFGDNVVGESGCCHLRLPFKKGETWESTAKNVYGDIVTSRYTNADEEEVEVPAGKFRCVRVESEFVVRGVTWKMTNWVAPRVGWVKYSVVGKDGAGKLGDYACTGVLKSFTPGEP
jgi:hypothetical protein